MKIVNSPTVSLCAKVLFDISVQNIFKTIILVGYAQFTPQPILCEVLFYPVYNYYLNWIKKFILYNKTQLVNAFRQCL